MNYFFRSLFLIAAVLLLPGCWNVTRDKLTLTFSRAKGSGTFHRTLAGLYCEDKGKSCSDKEYPDLEKMRDRYSRYLENFGVGSVKVKLKKLDGEVTGKFSALTQLPFFKEVRSRQEEQPGNRTDLVLELVVDEKGEFKAKEFAFEFVSSDEDSPIEEASPGGQLDAARRTVTWATLPGFGQVATLKIRLKGKSLAE